ncbi:MAG: double zinc ribbon domain-containing protein [Natronospirillum sp.]|uniref:ComF family protein n=1 Tax=Natronospirillum sp. TaxID=2812955 RepID=UPI0025DD4D38|nr:double zinc ribbon domain-containing protein [Natronospirillum sp.]MCH8553103.1 double zinc ribbon domain-containing protein [Natronospirillum sp.]
MDRCPACSTPAPRHRFCAGCEEDFTNQGPGCRFCGTPVGHAGQICGQCLQQGHPWDRLHFIHDFQGPWAALIRRLKYQGALTLTDPFAALLARQWRVDVQYQAVPMTVYQVVAMPMHRTRLLSRGFNQAGLLADSLARHLAIARRQPLYRTRETPPLEGLSRTERRRALDRAFASEAAGGHWLLVDDVFTTGASARQAARALRAAGADSVSLVMLARTPLSGDSHHSWLGQTWHGTRCAEDAPESPPHFASRSSDPRR